ncbi:oligo-1,6-glucosidase [Enterococcus sp. DIV2402]|uniref:Oligo-1,6-glucosidase n=4 Tax=Enterococcus TaxID=1350 RepID=A0ABZ2SL81_9ENTE|nr:alpha-glucosidase [Enterococcus sp. DIV2402]
MANSWWKESVVYQIYPKSFQDSNNDGIGDIKGIISRLDYIKKLGTDVIWICPVYKSPMDDGGYDISDYFQIDEMFGTNEDLDELLEKAKQLDIKVLMDLVVNHTSDEHVWFQEALHNPASKYRDYYIFKEGIDGNPPNNWRSYFGGSAWEPVPNEENMFYLHAFTKKQPDLNWENEEVREEIYAMINYWLDKGLGGFRIDAILNIKKRLEYGIFESDGEDGLAFIGHWILNQPGIEVWLKEMRERTFKPHNSMTVAEADVPNERLDEYIGEDGYYSMVFDFSYTDIDVPETGEWFKDSQWTWTDMRTNIFTNQLVTQDKGWGALYLENHDQPRSINKYIPEEWINDYSKKMLATLFMLLRGTPFIYQGQELGMTNIEMASLEDFDDVATHSQYKRALEYGLAPEQALKAVNKRSRDNSRTPMQWNTQKNAGFSTSDNVWLKVNPNYPELNAEAQLTNQQSVFNYYRQLIELRKNSVYNDVLIYGQFLPVKDKNEHILLYERQLEDKIVLVILNVTATEQEYYVDEQYQQVLINNYEDILLDQSRKLRLRPFESIVLANYGGQL